jgi:hypothetical protein
MTKNVNPEEYDRKRELVNEVDSNPKILDSIKENIYHEDGILEELERLNNLNIKNPKYQELYQKVIQVGEFKN